MTDRRPAIRLGVAGLVGALAFAMVLEITEPVGPGLDPDAVSYIGAARSFTATGRLLVPAARWSAADTLAPLRHFPPGLPFAIALPVRSGMDAVQGGRLVNATSAFILAATIVFVIADAASLGTAVVAALLVMVTSPVADMHMNVLSEPLFLACILLVLASMQARRISVSTVGGGVAAAAAVMVRYAGIAAGAAGSLWLLLDRETEPRPVRRLRNAIAAGVPTAIATGAWVLHNRPQKGEEEIRTIGLYGGWGATLRMALTTARDWLAPSVYSPDWQGHVAVVVLAIALVVAAIGGRELRSLSTAAASLPDEPAGPAGAVPLPDERRIAARRLLRSVGLLGIVYAAVIGLSRAFADPRIPFDERILSPLVLLAELAFAVTLGWWWRGRTLVGRAIAVGLLVVWGGASLGQTMDHADYAVDEGSDFANSAWRNSELVQWVRTEGRGRTLFTNWPAAVYFHAGRASRELPITADPTTLHLFANALARTHGVIIAFDVANKDAIQPDSLASLLDLHEVERVEDGVVWESKR